MNYWRPGYDWRSFEERLDRFRTTIDGPSLPGFGYSDKPATTGWGTEKIAAAWMELMERLGYSKFAAHGGD